MAVRAIDGDALRKELTCDFTGTPFHGNRKVTIGEVRRIIESMPTLTPPEIVCYQDCVHHEDGYAHWCNKWEHTCPDDSEFFCKYGRKKDGKDRSI